MRKNESLIRQLLEMAKSSTKRAKQKKRRIKKKKTETPTRDEQGNPVHKAMAELKGAGQGAHATTMDKARDTKRNRRQSKVTLRDY